jgi:hypothetical protein
MKRKGLLLAITLLAASGLAAWCLSYSLTMRPRLDPEVRDRIQPGMSLEEVTAIIGPPPGDYASFTLAPWIRRTIRGTSGEYGTWVWIGDRYAIVVMLDSAGLAQDRTLFEVSEPEDSLVDKLRRWRGP